MGEYANIKRKKMLMVLKKLSKVDGFEISQGGNHQWKVNHVSWKRPFPIPFKHNTIRKHYIKKLIKLVEKIDNSIEKDLKNWVS
jgi:hypothetical protein